MVCSHECVVLLAAVALAASLTVGQTAAPDGFTSVPRVREYKTGSGGDLTLVNGAIEVSFTDASLAAHAGVFAADLLNIAGITSAVLDLANPLGSTRMGAVRESGVGATPISLVLNASMVDKSNSFFRYTLSSDGG
jgi:hypothetical protein